MFPACRLGQRLAALFRPYARQSLRDISNCNLPLPEFPVCTMQCIVAPPNFMIHEKRQLKK